ncbi:LysR family transcriptional regulator [Paraferrimonas sedimenticola]|uniref:Transcriptional regulator n=1 Tax=Paraferrimonas sedimenticola TaxID=375674 RepID=A0AA37W0G6_9GAMM|nr:LysR family transcriptional regulator [Paraferrimonas sedimenticola]GLP96295.1 transcriptional regulator [Paraferrimonas sedimenticola]
MYTIKQLQAFVATAEHSGFSQAAKFLKKDRTTISELVESLEVDAGLKLFERHARKLTLTDTGQHLFQFAKATLEEQKLFNSSVEGLNRSEPNHLTLAVDSLLPRSRIYRSLATVAQQFPTIELTLLSGDTKSVMEWVADGRAEVGVLTSLMDRFEGLTHFGIFSFDIVDIAPPTWFNQGAVLNDWQVRSKPLINFRFLKNLDLSHQQKSHHNIYVNNVDEMVRMVASGIGWASVPSELAKPYIEQGLVSEFSFEGEQAFVWNAEVAYRTDRWLSSAADCFVDNMIASN